MTSRRKTTIVPHTADEMFDLVADVERYPAFIPWCVALRVVETNVVDGRGTMLADMVVAYKVFREKFRSRVVLDRPAGTIDVEYEDGPFRSLQNHWRFTDRPEGGSVIDFEIEFEFRNFFLQATAQAVFDKAFARMSEAFVTRADAVYG
ncbi:MAG: type II toxin-antitoxin system RatA family toxin [Hyphococcus sp.]